MISRQIVRIASCCVFTLLLTGAFVPAISFAQTPTPPVPGSTPDPGTIPDLSSIPDPSTIPDLSSIPGAGGTPGTGTIPDGNLGGFDAASIAGLDPTQFGNLTPDQIGNLDPAAAGGLDMTQIGNLDPAAVGGFSSDQLSNLDPAAVAGFDKSQLGNLDPAAVAGFNSGQLSSLAPSAIAGFNSGQVGNLDPTALGGLNLSQISNLDPAAVGGFDKSQISNLDPAAVGGFAASQLSNLDNDAVAGFDADQISGIAANAFSGLDSEQVNNIDPSALTAINGLQVENMTPESFRGFVESQIGSIPEGACPFMSGEQTHEMTPDAVGGFTPGQFEVLTPEAKAGFDRDNIGGLSQDVVQKMDSADLTSLNSTEIQNMPDKDFSHLATNFQDPSITASEVAPLLPSGWEVDSITDELTPPAGASLSLRSLDQNTLDDGSTVPQLPDLSRSLSVGAKVEDDNLLKGMDAALVAAGADGVGFRQSADGILTAVNVTNDSTPLGAFMPDNNNITQAADGFSTGLVTDDRGAFVLTTDKGQQIPLLPAPRNPDEIVSLLPNSTVSIGEGGETTITKPEGVSSNPISGKFNPILETSDKSPGLYRSGSGADEEIVLVYQDGSAQKMKPAMQSESEFDTAARAIPGVESTKFNTDGSIGLRFDGSDITLKPAFDIEPGSAGGKATPELIKDGDRFFFTNSSGDRQEFFL